jgi:hypothetical protein
MHNFLMICLSRMLLLDLSVLELLNVNHCRDYRSDINDSISGKKLLVALPLRSLLFAYNAFYMSQQNTDEFTWMMKMTLQMDGMSSVAQMFSEQLQFWINSRYLLRHG